MQLRSDDESQRVVWLSELRSFEEYGQLSKAFVLQELGAHKASAKFQSESMQADLNEIERKVRSSGQTEKKGSDEQQLSPRMVTMITWAEQFLDLGDAVARRKKADQIYQDLANYRVSRARDVVELQALTKRQKGGG